MADVIVVPEVGAESEPAAERLETAEAVAEAATDVAETQADAVVEVAQIEADRDVALAIIHQDGELAAAETFADALHDEELESCRNRISTLEAENLSLSTELESLRASSTPAPELNPPPPLDPGETPEDDSSKDITSGPGAEERPPSPIAAEGAAPAPPPRPRRKFKWI